MKYYAATANYDASQAQWCMPIISATEQTDQEGQG